MRYFLSIISIALVGMVGTSPAIAQEHLKIVDEPLELTVHMHHKRYPAYNEEWPVEQEARR
ncbi:MAG: hypothetical protein OXC02_09715, partial [Rhodobacteraceae bacterium]|nr:hypothetical protein [Paracoccaceae bacterium]